MTKLVNSGSDAAPSLKIYLNLDNLVELRPDSCWPGYEGMACYEKLSLDGFQGVQITDMNLPLAGIPFPYCGLDRINFPEEAAPILARHADRGDQCVTLHVGWGIEDDDQMDRLVEAILQASEHHHLPAFIETHRATITQDIWRTVQLTKRFPEIRFNIDISHYYTGLELAYGDWANKLAFMAPIFARTGFMHGRIGSPGCIQVPIESPLNRPLQADGPVDFLAHYRDLWAHAMAGFLRVAGPGDELIFAPELLSGTHYYARKFPNPSGALAEESDRYAQAILYQAVAKQCFLGARSLVSQVALTGAR